MRVRYLPRAFADLEAIHSYIAKHSPEAAVQVAGAITKSISGLAEFPEIGQAVDEENVRVLRSAHHAYNIFYSVIGEEIQILHIRHPARRPPEVNEL
jgi:toxin ParE1/3/4